MLCSAEASAIWFWALNCDTLHIPDGIRFDCTGCGNCCLHWPVPATDHDVRRIEQLSITVEGSADAPKFRRLPSGQASLRGFTHTLEKRKDGRCTFLTDRNSCSLHEQHGADAKPGMCRLFPYSFTPTPSGTFMYISFASTGALSNTGRALTEQRTEMQQQLALFKELYPQVDDDWSNIQLIDGTPISWNQYLYLDDKFLELLHPDSTMPVLDALQKCSEIARAQLPENTQCERLPPIEADNEIIDQILLKQFADLYWPRDVFTESSFDINARDLMNTLIRPPGVITICGGKEVCELSATKPADLPADQQALIRRFIYARVFAKLYFARSYAHLSVIAGIHHLFILVVLSMLQARSTYIEKGQVSFWDMAEIIRTLERRMTQMNFSRESCVVMEILFSSPSRLARLKQLAS